MTSLKSVEMFCSVSNYIVRLSSCIKIKSQTLEREAKDCRLRTEEW